MTQRPLDDLDALLGTWAAAQRLDEAEAGAIRRGIVDGPPLDAEWWSRLTAHVCAAVRVAGTPVPPPSPRGGLPRIAWSAA